jgi:hypothetical protein
MMVPQEMAVAKAEVESTVAQLWRLVESAAEQGTAAHVVEEQLFRKLLALGRQLYARFLALQGTGDVGERFSLQAHGTQQTGSHAHDSHGHEVLLRTVARKLALYEHRLNHGTHLERARSATGRLTPPARRSLLAG